MPELPEVETIVRGLAERVTGDVIESVWLGKKPEPLKSPAQQIAAALAHSHIAAVHRMGKHIVFDLEPNHVPLPPPSSGQALPKTEETTVANPPLLMKNRSRRGRAALQGRVESTKLKGTSAPACHFIVHLGMTGRLQVCNPNLEIPKHTHAILKLASGRELRFIDPRRFGRLSVVQSFDAGGNEPLEIDLEKFIALFRERKTPIKSALLNQKLLRGVGNIYADEALFRAGIRPRRRASTITSGQFARLLAEIKEVLNEAIVAGGSSISDYVDSDGEEGLFQLEHRVYGREGKPCLTCKSPIKRIVIAGRSSHYCPTCQK